MYCRGKSTQHAEGESGATSTYGNNEQAGFPDLHLEYALYSNHPLEEMSTVLWFLGARMVHLCFKNNLGLSVRWYVRTYVRMSTLFHFLRKLSLQAYLSPFGGCVDLEGL